MKKYFKKFNLILLTLLVGVIQTGYAGDIEQEKTVEGYESYRSYSYVRPLEYNDFITPASNYSDYVEYDSSTDTYKIKKNGVLSFTFGANDISLWSYDKDSINLYTQINNWVYRNNSFTFTINLNNTTKYSIDDILFSFSLENSYGVPTYSNRISLGQVFAAITDQTIHTNASIVFVNQDIVASGVNYTAKVSDKLITYSNKQAISTLGTDFKINIPKKYIENVSEISSVYLITDKSNTRLYINLTSIETTNTTASISLTGSYLTSFIKMLSKNADTNISLMIYYNNYTVHNIGGMSLYYDTEKPKLNVNTSNFYTARKDNVLYVIEGSSLDIGISDNKGVSTSQSDLELKYIKPDEKNEKSKYTTKNIKYTKNQYTIKEFDNLTSDIKLTITDLSGNSVSYTSLWSIIPEFKGCTKIVKVPKKVLPVLNIKASYDGNEITNQVASNIFPLISKKDYVAEVKVDKDTKLKELKVFYTITDKISNKVLVSNQELTNTSKKTETFNYKLPIESNIVKGSDTKFEITYNSSWETKDYGIVKLAEKHTFTIDNSVPTITLSDISDLGTIDNNNNKFYTKSSTKIDIESQSEDLAKISVLIDNKEQVDNKIKVESIPLKSSGEYKVTLFDKVGNEITHSLGDLLGSEVYTNIVIDNEAPKIDLKSKGMVVGDISYFKGHNIEIEPIVEDKNLLSATYELNGTVIELNNNKILLTEENKVNNLKITAYDLAKNKSEHTFKLIIDNIAPTITNGEIAGQYLENKIGGITFTDAGGLKFETKDNGVGIEKTEVFINGSKESMEPDENGFYPLQEDMETFEIVLTDKLGNKGSYNLSQVPKWKDLDKKLSLDNMFVDNTKPSIDIEEPQAKNGTNINLPYLDNNNLPYFKDDQLINIKLYDNAALEYASITVNDDEQLNWTPETKTNKKEVQIDTSKYKIADDGSYTINVYVKDTAENEVFKSYKLFIDKKAPSIKKFVFQGKGYAEGLEIGGSAAYGFYFKGDATVEIHAKDPNPGSGIKSIYYKLISDKGETVAEETVKQVINNVITVKLPNNFKGYVMAYAVDNVNNTGSFEQPDGVINTEINTTKIDINLPDTKYRDSLGNQLYNSKIDGEIVIENDSEGLREIVWGYRIIDDNESLVKDNQLGKVEIDNNGNLKGDKGSISKVDNNLVLDMLKGFTINENVNAISIYVRVINRIGDASETERTISIDTDNPVISVDYNITNAKGIYNQDRIATITIKERNFNKQEVKVSNIPNITDWESKGDIHTAQINFNKDSDYQFNVEYMDMAGNNAKGYSSDNFTIDKTVPTVNISYSRDNALNDIYYNRSRTAKVVVHEHNFDPKAIDIETTGLKGDWVSNDNDNHVLTIMFNRDGEHKVVVNGSDKAGNKLETYTGDKFIIDTVAPTISITGIKDGVSYKDELTSNVALADSYLDPDTIDIYLESNKHGNMNCEGSVNDKTGAYKLPEIPQKAGYDDAYRLVVSIKDKAGNSSSKTVDFTVNRFGSAYDIAGSEDILGTYTNVLPPEITISETSVDKIDIDKTTLFINKDGKEYYYDESLLAKSEEETEQNEYKYTYKLNSAAFKEDGKYSLDIVSVADDGTKNTSQKEDYTFIYDTTAPEIIMNGLESGTTYNNEATSKKFSISVEDMSDIMEADFKINGEEQVVVPDKYNTYTMELQKQDHLKQEISVYVKDRAGNESKKVISGVIVSDNFVDIIMSSNVLQFVLIGVMGVSIVALLISHHIYNKKTKKREEDLARENAES